MLKFSILRKYLTPSYLHNLKANFDKFIRITKLALSDYLLPDGNLHRYGHSPKMTDKEVISLSVMAEALGIDSKICYFPSLK